MNDTKETKPKRAKERVRWEARKHQPTKAEMEEDLRIDTTPERLIKALIDCKTP